MSLVVAAICTCVALVVKGEREAPADGPPTPAQVWSTRVLRCQTARARAERRLPRRRAARFRATDLALVPAAASRRGAQVAAAPTGTPSDPMQTLRTSLVEAAGRGAARGCARL